MYCEPNGEEKFVIVPMAFLSRVDIGIVCLGSIIVIVLGFFLVRRVLVLKLFVLIRVKGAVELCIRGIRK